MAKSTNRTTLSAPIDLEFASHYRRRVRARFSGQLMSSDGGGLILGEVDGRLGLIDRLAVCFADHRNPNAVTHSVRELIAQRVYGIALGYEDLNDHDALRSDPVLAMLCGKKDVTGSDRRGKPLASAATLNRLENSAPDAAPADRYRRIAANFQAMDDLLCDLFLEAHPRPPKRIVLDLDVTDDPVHGEQQEGRFYHGYYRSYCFLPLYVYCGQHLLACRLGVSNRDPGADVPEQISRIVERIRRAWPRTEIVLRGDSGFAREKTMAWCEENSVDFVFGLARNQRLVGAIASELSSARYRHRASGRPARFYRDFAYRTLDSWSRSRRVIGKAEHLDRGPNPRFVVTSLSRWQVGPAGIYERSFCPRGEMENRIKEMQLALFSDRTSASAFSANRLRLYFSGFAYVLLSGIRRLCPEAADNGRLRCDTIRLRFLKLAALIRITTRRIWITLPSACPAAQQYRKALAALARIPLYRAAPT